MSGGTPAWFDDAAGPLVRPYALTRGRTTAQRSGLQMITLVVALRPASQAGVGLDPEHLQILATCQAPRSIAELSAALDVPLSVVKVLVDDLIGRGLVMFRSAAAPDLNILQAVIDGIRRL